MLKKIVNQCRFDLKIETLDPMLIKSGTSVITGPDMAFVRTLRGNGLQPFVPGSSLKGVIRSHAERIARTLKTNSVCDVFDSGRIEGCSKRHKNAVKEIVNNSQNEQVIYGMQCPACKLFGSLLWKGRFNVSDAYLTPEFAEIKPELRDGIGIDRVSGGVAGGAKFDMEVLPAGVVFETFIVIENFEAWQLGWIAYVIRDLLEGYLSVGAGTSRGLGRIQGKLDKLAISYVGSPTQLADLETHVPGIGAFVTATECKGYGLSAADRVTKPKELAFSRRAGSLRSVATLVDSEQQLNVLAALAGAWDVFIEKQEALEPA